MTKCEVTPLQYPDSYGIAGIKEKKCPFVLLFFVYFFVLGAKDQKQSLVPAKHVLYH